MLRKLVVVTVLCCACVLAAPTWGQHSTDQPTLPEQPPPGSTPLPENGIPPQARQRVEIRANSLARQGEPLIFLQDLEAGFVSRESFWFVTLGGRVVEHEVSGDLVLVRQAQIGTYEVMLAVVGEDGNKYTARTTVEVQARDASAVERPKISLGTTERAPTAESETLSDFKKRVRERIVERKLHEDPKFPERRKSLAAAIQEVLAAKPKSVDAMEASIVRKLQDILYARSVQIPVQEEWLAFFGQDIGRLARQENLPLRADSQGTRNLDDYTAFYAAIASELEGKGLDDDAFTADVAKYLAEKGYSIQSTSGAAGRPSGGRRRLFHRGR